MSAFKSVAGRLHAWRVVLAAGASVAAAGVGALGAPAACEDCVKARYWQVDPNFWKNPDLSSFPERAFDGGLGGADLGVAFSGGGTRSASATIGQLRGLLKNGWLPRVRYATAVSGGSWAAVPFTYSPDAPEALTGPVEQCGDLTPDTITETAAGKLAERVVASQLASTGIQEVPQFLPDEVGGRRVAELRGLLISVRDALRKVRRRALPDPARRNKTYAHMLGQVFIAPLVPDGNRRPYTWTRQAALDLSATSGRPAMEFTQAAPGRPFLIVGGTLVWAHPAFVYPRLIPVEYTPLYTGARQRFGNLGGTYVSPWAYDRSEIAPESDTLLRVGPGPNGRMFTLADMIASSGAAPQLALLLGDRVPERLRAPLHAAAEAFPAFATVAVRNGRPESPPEELPHGDGGFTDNLGLMPLVARQVRNIIVFVNANKPYTSNDQLQSYFFSLALRDGNGDKSMDVVFESSRYRELLDGLDAATAQGGPAIYCGKKWSVLANELYNVAAYEGLNVCWVYNYAAASWKQSLPAVIQTWLDPCAKAGQPECDQAKSDQAKALGHFPYYATFGENKPRVIKLTALQVNLLAHLGCWSVSNPVSARAIVGAFGEDVAPAVSETNGSK